MFRDLRRGEVIRFAVLGWDREGEGERDREGGGAEVCRKIDVSRLGWFGVGLKENLMLILVLVSALWSV